MKLHPQQAPLYGDCIITVLLTEDDEVQSVDAAFYLVFTGSAVQHCSSTRKLDSGTLETLAPGHDCCETVRVSLCATKQGCPVLVVAEDNFQFVQDEAYDAAQFLASCAGNQQALNFTRFLDHSRPPAADVDFLDEKVALAFRHLKLPAEWNVLGAEQSLSEHVPRETLLHFAVRLGLLRLTWFLLQQPGGQEALGVPNSEGATPTSLALERGYQKLHQLLAEEGAREPDAWSSLSHTVHSGEHLVRHHRRLNVYTLTAEALGGSRPSLEGSIQQLRRHMESHQQHKMASECPPSSPGTACETCEVAAGDGAAGGAMAEGGEAAAPAPLDLGAIQIAVPACPEEDGCSHGREPWGTPGDPSSEAAAEDPVPSCNGRERAGQCEEEGEELPPAAGAGALLGENDGTLSLLPGLPSGDTREGAGMPSHPDAAPGQGSCCGGDAFGQEAQTTESVAEPPASCQDCGVGMGQAECRSCTGGKEAAVAPQGAGDGGCDCGAPGRVAVETGPAAGAALTDPAGAGPGDVRDAVAPCRTEGSVPEPATVLQGGTCLDADRKVGTDAPASSARTESATGSADGECLAVEGQSAAVCRGAEVGEGHTAGVVGTVPEHAPALGANVDGEGDAGLDGLDLSGGERGAAASVESDGPDPRRCSAPESSGASDAVMEMAPGMPGGQEASEPPPGGSADPPEQGTREEGDLDPAHAGASEPAVPAPSPSPTGPSPGGREPLGRQAGGAQELLALASALLVGEAVLQAQRVVARESSATAAPAGQEAASRHPEPVSQTLLPCEEGTEGVQDNLTGTPSARHSAESKQQQEVAAEQPAVAGQGSPASGAPAAGPLPPAGPAGSNAGGLLSPQLPGREGALAEGPAPAPAPVEQSPPGSRGEALPGSDSHAPLESTDEASRLGAGEGGRVVLPGPGRLLSEDGPVPADEAPLRSPEPEPCPAPPAASPLSGPPSLMEAPLLPISASLPREGEGADGLPSRLLLQPIAEELLGDGDSASEGSLLAHSGERGPCAPAAPPEVLAQPSEHPREASGVQTAPPVGPPCGAPDPLEKAEAKDSEAATEGILLDHTDKTASPAGEAACAEETSEPLAAPADAPFAVEPRPDAQRVMGAASVPQGAPVVGLQPGGLTERVTRPPPVADSGEMEPGEETGAMRGLAEEDAAAEERINRENWSPGEPSSDPALLKLKSSCNDTERDHDVEDGLGGDCTSSQDVLTRESGSESDLFPLPGDGMDEMDFGKLPEEEQSAGDSTSSSSSADDTISLERNSSLGSDISLPQALGLSRPKDRYSLEGSCFGMVTAEGQDGDPAISGELEEELDSITDVPAHSSVLRNSMRPLSPFRRHSWGPGKNASSEAEISQRSSMRVLGDVVRKLPTHRRSLSWCPSGVQCTAMGADSNGRSYSLEGLAGEADGATELSSSLAATSLSAKDLQQSPLAKDDRGSLVSLTEEELESEQGEGRGLGQQIRQRSQPRSISFYATPVVPPLTKSMSLMTIAQAGADSSRPFSSSSANSSLTQSISEEESCQFLPPSSSRKDLEGKSGTKVSRTFSYLKNKMSSSKKSKEKEREKDKDSKEKDKDKKTVNGHLFSTTPTVGPINCYHCMKPFNKDAVSCPTCGIMVHKSCKEAVTACAKVRMKKGGLQPHDTSSLPTVVMRNKSSQPKERPHSAILAPDESAVTSLFNNRRSQQNPSLSKSVSIQNIAGVGNDESILHTLKFLSQSTDSLNKINRVNESTESLTDEGADMNEGQLMGDFEMDSKQLEAQSWSQVVEGKFLRQQKKDVVKRQDVIYELMQTEMHHIRTLKIMSDVYCRGMVQELQCEQQVVEKVFPCLDSLLSLHSQFFQRILERKKESLAERSSKNFVIRRIGDILLSQFSGENAERMKKTYGKFCGHHNEAVNYFKDLLSKDKRFQAFIKKKMSSSVVRRLGIPECILLVTQRITKYPVLLQRILQYTKETDAEHQDLVLSLNLVKEVITAVNSKVSNYEKKLRLHEIYTRTDLKSIMRMKSGQMFAREDLRRRRFVRDGTVSLRNAAGRLKEVQAVLLEDVLIFLQEKDQKYIFASLDQKSTVISLKKLIVREVAHEEKGLFLISMGGKDPEMVEVHASSKEERSSWIRGIQDTINTLDKEEDEGIPSELEEEKRVLDMKARELKEQLQQRDKQIVTLLEEKERIFRHMTDSGMQEDSSGGARTLFRANMDEAPKGESVMKSVIREVELLQGMVSQSLGSALGQQMCSLASEQEGVGPVSLPRRAETFGGFDSHQMSVCKGGERDEGEDAQDLRRTESDSVLKKGGIANLMFILRRNNEQVLQSITHLHSLLSTLQAVVVQQDTYIEDQKVLLTERALSRGSFRPSSLVEQEKQRSLERQRQELANLQRQQAQHQEEKRRREREWGARERELAEREAQLAQREEQTQRGLCGLEEEREELRQRKAAYQLDLEHLRAAQRQLEKEQEQMRRDVEQVSRLQAEPGLCLLSIQHAKMTRTASLPVPEVSPSRPLSSPLSKQGPSEAELSPAPKRSSLSRTHKEKSSFHLLGTPASNQTSKPAEGHNRLFGLAKPKEKKEKRKKRKGPSSPNPADSHSPEAAPEGEEIFC